ncbi:hypothetical protein PIROE2DRAFT_7055, partial [Piromyces sp. E2]
KSNNTPSDLRSSNKSLKSIIVNLIKKLNSVINSSNEEEVITNIISSVIGKITEKFSEIKEKISDDNDDYNLDNEIFDSIKNVFSTLIHLGNDKFLKHGIDTAEIGISMKKMMMVNSHTMVRIIWYGHGQVIILILVLVQKFGIYTNGKSKNSHWEVDTDTNIQVSLTLTHKNKDGTVEAVEYQNVDSSELTASFNIKFPNEKMFKAFVSKERKGYTYDMKNNIAILKL